MATFTGRGWAPSLGGRVERPDRHRDAVRGVWRRSGLLHVVAIRQPEELRGLRVGDDTLDAAADFQVAGRPVRIDDRQRDGGLKLPVPVLLAGVSGGRPPGWA